MPGRAFCDCTSVRSLFLVEGHFSVFLLFFFFFKKCSIKNYTKWLLFRRTNSLYEESDKKLIKLKKSRRWYVDDDIGRSYKKERIFLLFFCFFFLFFLFFPVSFFFIFSFFSCCISCFLSSFRRGSHTIVEVTHVSRFDWRNCSRFLRRQSYFVTWCMIRSFISLYFSVPDVVS